MEASLLFVCDVPQDQRMVNRLLPRLPQMRGAPVRLQRSPGLRDGGREVHAGSFLRERRIAFNCTRGEFPRIFVHELFHFVWLRAGNPRRRSFENLLQAERPCLDRGELGWSAEWRRAMLQERDLAARTRRWRDYVCESFCDTAAWMYSGIEHHPEFTLDKIYQRRRRRWFVETLEGSPLSI